LEAIIKLKDSVVSYFIEKYLPKIVREYISKELKFKIDSINKKITLEVLLKGESEIIKIEVYGYKIVEKNKAIFFEFDKIVTSREWLNVLIENYKSHIPSEIPKEYELYAKTVKTIV